MNANYSSGLPSRGEIRLPKPEQLSGKDLADRPHAPSKPEASAKPTVTTDAGYAPIMAAVDMYTEAQILKHIHQLQRPHRPLLFTVAPGCGYMHSNSIHSHTARHHPIRNAEPRSADTHNTRSREEQRHLHTGSPVSSRKLHSSSQNWRRVFVEGCSCFLEYDSAGALPHHT